MQQAMHFSFIIFVLALFEFARTSRISLDGSRTIARSKRQYDSDLGDSTNPSAQKVVVDGYGVQETYQSQNHKEIAYEFGIASTEITIMDGYSMEGKKGYVYLTLIVNATYSAEQLYVKFGTSNSPYFYHFLLAPNTSSDWLAQANAEGQKGYRFKRTLYYTTGDINVYVRSSQQPKAMYTYRVLPGAQNPGDLLKQSNAQGAKGYRYYGWLAFEGRPSLFIKDDSQESQFVYAIVLMENSTAEFLQNANNLGKQGYRFLLFYILINPTYPSPPGSPYFWQFSIYSKETSNPASTFSYVAKIQPATFNDFSMQLQEQAKKGFLYKGSNVFGTEDSTTIYMNIDHCQCENIALDATF